MMTDLCTAIGENLCFPRRFSIHRGSRADEEGTTKEAKDTKDKAPKSSVFICVHLWLIPFRVLPFVSFASFVVPIWLRLRSRQDLRVFIVSLSATCHILPGMLYSFIEHWAFNATREHAGAGDAHLS
jgi:hypothetical protein